MTDTPMKERVARAICRQTLIDLNSVFGCWQSDAALDAQVEAKWREYEREAAAAIAAMREPTEEMLEAGRRANELTDSNKLGLRYVSPDGAWRAMIDEAMK